MQELYIFDKDMLFLAEEWFSTASQEDLDIMCCGEHDHMVDLAKSSIPALVAYNILEYMFNKI